VPKDLFEIKQFETGNVYNADDRDIPDDAAVYSENIDPYSQAGSLMGIHGDTVVKAGVDTTRMSIINDNGTHRLVYVDKSDFDIKKVDDVHGTPSVPTVVESGTFGTSSSIAAMQVNNKEVHMGIGKDKNPKWVGIISHGQFGTTAPSGIQSTTAELTSPNPFPLMHAVIADSTNTYVYGIQANGKFIYKFDIATGILVRRSEYFFTSTQAITLASDGNLYVADQVASNFTMLKIDKDNMDVITSRVITGTTGVTDLMICGNTMWLARGNYSGNTFLYNISVSNLSTGSTSVAATNRSPFMGVDQAANVSAGDWATDDDQKIAVAMSIPKLPLIRVTGSNSYVGIATYVKPSESTAYARFYYATGSTDHTGGNTVNGQSSPRGAIRWWAHVIRDTYTAGEKLSTITKGACYAFSQVYNKTYDKVYQVKQTSNSTYLNFVEEGASSNVTSLFRQNKLAYNHTDSNLIDITRNNVGTDIDVEDAILDEISGSYNVFSSGGQVRWAAGSSGSLVKKAEGEVELVITNNTSVAGSINPAHDHFYATSFTYDGYQESPLSSWLHLDNSSISEDSLNVDIGLYISNLSKRVTHVNLYRSSAASASALQPSGFFRLIKSVSLKSGWLEEDSSTTNPNWGTHYSKTIIDDGVAHASYEARTGMSEALIDTLPKYTLSSKVNNFLYITGCSHIDIDDATNYLFKSRPFNFDQFNIIRDYLLLPNTATAMETFNGRLYVYSENEMYIINPDGMFIEDTIKGIGCRNQNSVISSDVGLCWMDKNSVYYHDGSKINDIGRRIKKAHQLDDIRNSYSALDNLTEFNSADYGGDIVLGYDGYRKSFCFFYQYKFDTATTTTSSFTQVGCSYDDLTESVTHSPNSNIVAGLAVSGLDIPANTVISDIVQGNPTRFEISNMPTGTQTNTTLTFTSTVTTTVTTYIPQCLVYTAPKNRWDVWNRPYTSNLLTLGAINGKSNELIVSDNVNGLIKPFNPKSNTRLDNFIWYSKKFTMGDSTSDKKFYKAEILSEDSTPTIVVNTAENSGAYSALSAKRTARHAQVKLSVTGDATATIDGMRLVFRRLKRTKDMS